MTGPAVESTGLPPVSWMDSDTAPVGTDPSPSLRTSTTGVIVFSVQALLGMVTGWIEVPTTVWVTEKVLGNGADVPTVNVTVTAV